MTGTRITDRRILIALIVALVLIQVGLLTIVLRPTAPDEAAPGPSVSPPERITPSAVSSVSSEPTSTRITEVEHWTNDVAVPESSASATDIASLARAFDEERAAEHLAHLASDELSGRQPGTRGGKEAGAYVAEQFAAYGLSPAGINGTYYQTFTVPYGRITAQPVLAVTSAEEETPKRTHAYRTDYRALTGGYIGAGEATGPVIWLNSCLDQDYTGLNMEDKVVLCRYSGDPQVYRAAIEHQVGGLLLMDRERPDEPFRRGGHRETAWVPETIPAYLISPEIAGDLLIGSDYTLDDLSLRFSATPLSSTVHMEVAIDEQSEVAARNVLGLLPGSDPAYKDQVVVIGAHYDHLGEEPDGEVMNGANDNASGVATMLELARLWQAQDVRPARSVLFAAWDGEEQGLLGSRHYVEHPTQSLTRTIAMLNLDMVGAGERLQIDGDGIVAEQLKASASTYGITHSVTFHGSSDHAPFQNARVPAAMLIYWPDTAYHTPADEMSAIDPQKLKAVGTLSTHALTALAQGYVELEQTVKQLEVSVATGDREAFLALLNPGSTSSTDASVGPERHSHSAFEAAQAAWFDNVQAGKLTSVTFRPGHIRIGDNEATVRLEIAYGWADDHGRARRASYDARFVRRNDAWRFAGYSLDTLEGDVVAVERWSDVPVTTRQLLSTTEELYVSIASDLGATPVPGTRFVIYPSDDTLRAVARPKSDERVGWLVASPQYAEIAWGEPITPAVVSLVLNQMGLPQDEGTWLREGLALRFESGIAEASLPTLTSVEGVTPWTNSSTTGEAVDEDGAAMRAYSWSASEYLLSQYGRKGLRALCEAWGREGRDSAFEEALGISLPHFEGDWHDEWIEPLRATAAGIRATLDDREASVLDRDQEKFLSTVTMSDSVLRSEERHRFAALIDRPVLTYSLDAEIIGWTPASSHTTVILQATTEISGGDSSAVAYDAHFVREDEEWRYADSVWHELANEDLILKYQSDDMAWAEHILAQTERVYDQVTADLGAFPALPQEIKLYGNEETFRASIGPSLPQRTKLWTAEGASIKLWLDSRSDDRLLASIAQGLTHKLMLAQGVETDWVREGVAAYQSDRLQPLGAHWGSAQRGHVLREAIVQRRDLDWKDLSSLNDLSEEEAEVARAQAWSLVTTIVREHGLSGLRRFVDEVARAYDLPSNLRAALGTDPETFLMRWREEAATFNAPSDLISLAQRFDVQTAMEHVRLLASPEFGGRRAGSPEAELTAAYIAERFSSLGLEPVGDQLTATVSVTGTASIEEHRYLQQFPISTTRLITRPTLTSFLLNADAGNGSGAETLTYRQDFMDLTGGGSAEGQLVWVSASDVVGLHFGGNVVIERTEGNPVSRATELEEQGASGLIVVGDREPEELKTARGGSTSEVANRIPVFEITEMAWENLLDELGIDSAELASSPPALPLDMRVRMALPRTPTTTTLTANVLGIVPGSDPELAQQVLIVGAHYDHIGRLPGSDYFPGANQNASGVAGMLEMARLWQEMDYRPARSVLLAAWGAEEQGSSGVMRYLQDPAVPLTQTVGVISLDSIADGGGYRLWFRGDRDRDLPLLHRLEISASQLDREAWRRGSTDEGWHALFTGEGIPTVKLTWAESEKSAYRLTDTAGAIDLERLANSGEILTLGITWLADQ